MKILNITPKEIRKALAEVNKVFSGNIKTIDFQPINRKGTSYKLRLTVKDSSKPGARRSSHMTKKDGSRMRIKAACWHVHGAFFEGLLDRGAKIRLSGNTKIDSHKQNWQDRNMGSTVDPCYFSEACECNQQNISEGLY